MPKFGAEQLRRLYEAFMNKLGASEEEAATLADMFVEADLTGVEVQGLSSINRHVIDGIRKGITKLGQQIRVIKEGPSLILLDGANELGQVTCKKAMELAIKKAKETGVGVVSIRNLADTGMLAYYTTMALEHDCIGIFCNNTGPAVAPWGGREAVLGIDPMSIAIPTGKERPIIIDMAVTQLHQWDLNKPMASTGFPGVLLFRSPREYCLGIVADLLAAGLSGMPLGKDPSLGQEGGFAQEGGFCMAIHVPHFLPVEEFKQRVDRYVAYIKSSQLSEGAGEILMPGERGLREKEKRLREGIPVPEKVWEDTKALADELAVNWKKALGSS